MLSQFLPLHLYFVEIEDSWGYVHFRARAGIRGFITLKRRSLQPGLGQLTGIVSLCVVLILWTAWRLKSELNVHNKRMGWHIVLM